MGKQEVWLTMRWITLLGLLALPLLAPMTQAEDLHYSVGWIGNTFSGKDAWVLQDVAGIQVMPDGTVFTNVFWDEAGGNVQQYRDGQLQAVAKHTHGWGYQGGDSVAANSRYLFIVANADSEGGHLVGNSWPPKGYTWSGISRRLRNDISTGAPFPGGRGKEGDVLPGAFLPVIEIPEGQHNGAIRGVWADESRLFVSSPFDNSIKVYNTQTMKPFRDWHVDRPDKLCGDSTGRIWVLQRPGVNGRWRALRFTDTGEPDGRPVVFPPTAVPTDLCMDSKGRLLVADNGPDQQIKIYGNLDREPLPEAAFGVRGGILASPRGQFGDRRFNAPRGIGVDGAGNLYVASSGSVAGGSTVLESYTPQGRLRWRVMGLTFVDLADADPRSPADVFTKEEHFVMDYDRPPGSAWSYRAYTVDRFRYPDDPRLHTSPTNGWIRILDGQRFLFVTDMTADYLSVYRFHPSTNGEIAIPCVLFGKRHTSGYPPHQPDKGEWMWRDGNGNGAIDDGEITSNVGVDSAGVMLPDEQGTIWQANGNTIRALPFRGLDSHGVPQWEYTTAHTYPKPPELDEVRRLRYLPKNDIMILGGNRGEDRNQHWKPMGPVLCEYEGWSSGKPTLRREVVLPYEKGSKGHESIEPISFDVAGDYIFVAYTRGLAAEGLKNAFVKVLRLSDLMPVGNLSAENQLGETGLLDLVESVDARKTPTGEYVVFLEDDYRSKIVVFRWRP